MGRALGAAAGTFAFAAVVAGSSITAASASTGKYRHISGRGTYTSRVRAVLRRNAKGRCSQSRLPRAFQQMINARGPVRGVGGHRLPHRWAKPRRSAHQAP
jgi:hypothetical protein